MSTMDPANVPLPDTLRADDVITPDAVESPSATESLLAASSTLPALNLNNSFLAPIYRCVNATAEAIVPGPVRQGWHILFTTARDKYIASPASYRYGGPICAFLAALAEYQQPGFLPRPDTTSNAIIGLLCAIALVLGILALQEYVETKKWPWQDEGWVWPWEAWLWGETVYDLGASTTTDVNGVVSPARRAETFSLGTPLREPSSYTPEGSPNYSSLFTAVRHNTTPWSRTNDNISMPPPNASKQPIIIPPTPQLPLGMRPIYISPPTPAQIHHSGLLGESPGPRALKNFNGSGNAFFERAKRLREVDEWSKPGPPTSNLRTGLAQRMLEKQVLVERSMEGGSDARNEVHEA
ncbi:hypothetical protein BKA63DRAFT_572209 [Paraphoma chrysanthemicola]|nr:hypothetical protein BKA63DRAFT_572209 [Paraphoma chrysanthemicola]